MGKAALHDAATVVPDLLPEPSQECRSGQLTQAAQTDEFLQTGQVGREVGDPFRMGQDRRDPSEPQLEDRLLDADGRLLVGELEEQVTPGAADCGHLPGVESGRQIGSAVHLSPLDDLHLDSRSQDG